MSSCVNSTNDKSNVELELQGLENLGANFEYQGWLVVGGEPVSIGVLPVDENGELIQSIYEVDAEKLEESTAFVVTIEPSPDNNPLPSPTHVVAGDFDGNQASLDINHTAALGCNFNDASGKFVLATPTDGDGNNDEDSGVWFLDNSSSITTQGLDIPELPDGWTYEGWANIEGVFVSTGTFRYAGTMDDEMRYSGGEGAPPFPGEDFLNDAPDGLEFPVSLKGASIMISVEPVPDNSEAPFIMQPLSKMIPFDQETHVVIGMESSGSEKLISGIIRR